MPGRPIIIDCDPGQDDAIALLLAMSSPAQLDLLAITTVAGNVPLPLTQRNARLICDIAGRPEVPVYAGCDKPLQRTLITAENVHGKTGIDGIAITSPKTPLSGQHAVEYLSQALATEREEKITLVPIGPLTNIAAALQAAPAIAKNVREIVLMGGAMREGGNHSPSAEFNMLVDPHAADIVFRSGVPITVMGLDVTHQVLASGPRRKRIRSVGNAAATATADMLDFFDRHDSVKYGSDGAPLHDPCTIAWLLEPELFSVKPCNLSVETSSELTMGHTAVDFWHVTDRPRNVNWACSVDARGFYDLLVERLGWYS